MIILSVSKNRFENFDIAILYKDGESGKEEFLTASNLSRKGKNKAIDFTKICKSIDLSNIPKKGDDYYKYLQTFSYDDTRKRIVEFAKKSEKQADGGKYFSYITGSYIGYCPEKVSELAISGCNNISKEEVIKNIILFGFASFLQNVALKIFMNGEFVKEEAALSLLL